MATKELQQGDVVEDISFPQIGRPLPAACCTPACDLAIQDGGIVKASFVVFCALFRDQDFFYSLKRNTVKKFDKGTIKQVMSGSNLRYFPVYNSAKGIFYIVDYQLIASLPIKEAQALKIVFTLESPFKEALTAGYGSYMGRIGTPNFPINPDVYAEEMLRRLAAIEAAESSALTTPLSSV